MLFHVNRDIETIPANRREFLRNRDRQLTDLLAAPIVGPAAQRHRRRAVIAHAVSFWTWWSLCHEGGLTDREAIDVLSAAVFS